MRFSERRQNERWKYWIYLYDNSSQIYKKNINIHTICDAALGIL